LVARSRRLALPILTLLASACSWVLDTTQDYAENATLEVTGTSPVPLQVVSSTNWVYITNPANGEQIVSTTSADTVSLQLPINRVVPLTNSFRIYFKVINGDINQTASILMRVRLDNKLVYDQAANMRDASLDYSFAYGRAVFQ
jgi:hypothetical protein